MQVKALGSCLIDIVMKLVVEVIGWTELRECKASQNHGSQRLLYTQRREKLKSFVDILYNTVSRDVNYGEAHREKDGLVKSLV